METEEYKQLIENVKRYDMYLKDMLKNNDLSTYSMKDILENDVDLLMYLGNNKELRSILQEKIIKAKVRIKEIFLVGINQKIINTFKLIDNIEYNEPDYVIYD